MYDNQAIVRVRPLLTNRPHKPDHPVLKYVGMVGYIQEVDAPGKCSLFQGIDKGGNPQLAPIWLPWRCLKPEDGVEWRMAFINNLSRARAEKAKQAISQIAPEVTTAVNELRKFCGLAAIPVRGQRAKLHHYGHHLARDCRNHPAGPGGRFPASTNRRSQMRIGGDDP